MIKGNKHYCDICGKEIFEEVIDKIQRFEHVTVTTIKQIKKIDFFLTHKNEYCKECYNNKIRNKDRS